MLSAWPRVGQSALRRAWAQHLVGPRSIWRGSWILDQPSAICRLPLSRLAIVAVETGPGRGQNQTTIASPPCDQEYDAPIGTDDLQQRTLKIRRPDENRETEGGGDQGVRQCIDKVKSRRCTSEKTQIDHPRFGVHDQPPRRVTFPPCGR